MFNRKLDCAFFGGYVKNALWFGDNLHVLREHLSDESVDLIYLDPPFKSDSNYNVLFKSPVGRPSDAQVHAFTDMWKWGDEAELALDDVREKSFDTFKLLKAMKEFLGHSDVMAYLSMMAVRLIELRRTLKYTGSIYLHCDPAAGHYLKILMDGIFGAENFRAEIGWKRTNARTTVQNWPRIHDTILFYSSSNTFKFYPTKIKGDLTKIPHTLVTGPDGKKYQSFELTGPGQTQSGDSGKPWRSYDPNRLGRHWGNQHRQMDAWDAVGLIHWPKNGGWPRRRDETPFDPHSRVVIVGDLWTDIDRINQSAKERLGYPTQKPLALLDRIIRASSDPGDIVLDPFCGCGTTIHAAEVLQRRWIGIDITHLAIQIIEDRLQTWLGAAKYEVRGIPKTEEEARALARIDPYQFQLWAVSQLDGHPRGRGADRGVDGEIAFLKSARTYGHAIISVKAGQNVNPGMVRDLVGTVVTQGADAGVFVCVEEATPEMKIAASAAGVIQTESGKRPKVQIVTVRDLVDGPRLGLGVTLNTIAAAQASKVKPKPAKRIRPEEPQFMYPVKGGRAQQISSERQGGAKKIHAGTALSTGIQKKADGRQPQLLLATEVPEVTQKNTPVYIEVEGTMLQAAEEKVPFSGKADTSAKKVGRKI